MEEQGILLRASSVRSFFEVPSQWYKNHILGEDKFEGNTATVLGSVVHRYAECYFNGEEFDENMILDEANADIDVELIRSEFPAMCEVLERDYLSLIEVPEHIELYNSIERDGVKFQGTCDAINGKVLVDYKTSGKPKKQMDEYVYQLNIYAYLVSLKGIEIDVLRVVNIARRTKTLPPRVTIIECKADVKKGEELVNMMIDKTNLVLRNPEFKDLIFSENPYSFLGDGFDIENRIIEMKGD